MTWPDNTIAGQWLQITVKSTSNTGIAAPDVFYFGNAMGETGNSPTDAAVTSADILGTRSHFDVGPVPITNNWDFNRDGTVGTSDFLAARSHQTSGDSVLSLIQAPSSFAIEGSIASNGVFDRAVYQFILTDPVPQS